MYTHGTVLNIGRLHWRYSLVQGALSMPGQWRGVT